MWFDVKAALKEVLEQYPEAPDGSFTASENSRAPGVSSTAFENSAAPHTPQLTGTPNETANMIIDMLRECETLAQASEIVTRHQDEIARIEEAEPARKVHIESYLQYRWHKAQRGQGGGT